MECVDWARQAKYSESKQYVNAHGWLTSLCVLQEQRRSGCGRALLLEAEALLLRWRFDASCLQVDSGNDAALALYSAAGYQSYRHQRYTWWAFWTPLTIQLMVKDLSDRVV